MASTVTQFDKKISTRDEVVKLCQKLKLQKKVIGFSSGAFDLLHAGHVEYLETARSKCDLLIVAVNSNASIQKYKSKDRPIQDLQHRIKVLAGLAAVDVVFDFDETNNNENINIIKPDIYFKAADYNKDQLSSAKLIESYGGKVELISIKSTCSSSEIIKKIQTQVVAKNCYHEELSEKESAPAVFLDRDGTLIEHVEYLHEADKLKLLPGVIEGLLKLQNAGCKIIVITNQPGIGIGYFSKEDFYVVTKEMFKQFSIAGIGVSKVYFCPHSKAENCDCRKPATGLIQRAVSELNIDLSKSFVVGDMTGDIQLAKNAGLCSVLVETGMAGKDQNFQVQADYTAGNFLNASNFILDKLKELEQSQITTAQSISGADISNKIGQKTDNLRREKLEAIGKVGSKLGHDFNNILGVLKGSADLLKVKIKKLLPEDTSFERQFSLIDRSLKRGLEITSEIRNYIRPGELAVDNCPLVDCVNSVVKNLQDVKGFNFDFILTKDSEPLVSMAEHLVSQMLVAITVNALEAMEDLSEKFLRIDLQTVALKNAEIGELKAGEYVRLVVLDHGKGVKSEQAKNIFQPFFSTKPNAVGKGMGLNLAMAYELMHKAGGEITLTSLPDCGTALAVYFPVAMK